MTTVGHRNRAKAREPFTDDEIKRWPLRDGSTYHWPVSSEWARMSPAQRGRLARRFLELTQERAATPGQMTLAVKHARRLLELVDS